MSRFEKLYLHCQKVIPLIYSNSLSYYEQLCKLVQITNEIIETLNTGDDFYIDYVNEEIKNLKNYVDRQDQNNYNNLKLYFESEISNLNADLISEIYKLDLKLIKEINNLKNQYKNEMFILESKINLKIEQFENEIYEIINKYQVLIFNPLTSKNESVEKTVNDVYNALRYEAFTCLEFDSSGITCSEFNDSQVTCYIFDVRGKNYFHKNLCECVINNTTTGVVDSISQVLNSITALNYNEVTCSYFDGKQLTCETFDNLQITGYGFNFIVGVLN